MTHKATEIGQRFLNLGLVLSFLACYLEWGGGNAMFVGQMEYLILFEKNEASNFAHPFIAIPFAGQLLVLFTLFQKTPGLKLTTAGIILMGVLVVLLAFIGIVGANASVGLSTVPFFTLSVMHFLRMRKVPG